MEKNEIMFKIEVKREIGKWEKWGTPAYKEEKAKKIKKNLEFTEGHRMSFRIKKEEELN